MQCFLPRPMNESKRKLSFKHHCQFQNVRPRKVLEAAKYLVQTSELFQNEHIQVQENWLNNVNTEAMIDDWQEFVNSSTNQIDELRSSDPLEELAKSIEQSRKSEANGITDSKLIIIPLFITFGDYLWR